MAQKSWMKAYTEMLASYIVQMYELLTSHFFKEENVLFPMAENLLSAAEKDELEEKICTTGLQ